MPLLSQLTREDEGGYVVSDFATTLERSFNPYNDRSLRVPFYMTSSYRNTLKKPGVSMLMNPSSVKFTQDKRITEVSTQGGKVFYHWTDRNGRNNSNLTLEFSGQTGNINLRAGTVQKGAVNAILDKYEQSTNRNGEQRTSFLTHLNNLAESNSKVDSTKLGVVLAADNYVGSGAAKLANFLNLYSLTREPMIDPVNNRPVTYYISYSSPTFGNTFVTFMGHFNRVLEFSDDANSPFSVHYSFGFSVRSSDPPMDSLYSVATANLSSIFSNPIDSYTDEGR
jgi:hypothetical protein